MCFNSGVDTAFRIIALIGKYQTPQVAESLGCLAEYLRSRGLTVLIESETASATGDLGFVVADYDTLGGRADLAIVIGGDGTMLNAARRLARFGVPLVGVNEGRLGFMTDVARQAMIEHVSELLAGRYRTDRRFLLAARVIRDGLCVMDTLALNDVVLNKGDLGRMIEFEISIDGEFVYSQRSDGIIVSTPTGSTAYALAANGPILHPSVAGIALVPLCPHALSNRPITVSDSCRIEIALIAPHDARVHCDGQTRFDFFAGDRLVIERSEHDIFLLHPEGYSYFSMLRSKLHWSEPPRNHS